MDQHFLCHVLGFVFVGKVEEIIQFPFGVVNKTGEYAVCHFVNQDVFSNERLAAFLYRQGNHTSYITNENCALIRGWAKHTSEIKGNVISWWSRWTIWWWWRFEVKNLNFIHDNATNFHSQTILHLADHLFASLLPIVEFQHMNKFFLDKHVLPPPSYFFKDRRSFLGWHQLW